MIQIWPQKYLSYDMNIVAHSMYLKPNSCKSQWSPEIMYYTLPGVMVCKVSSSAGGEIHNVQWEVLDKAGGANQLRYQAPPDYPWAHRMLPVPVHLTSLKDSHVNYPLFLTLLLQNFIGWLVLWFYPQNTPGRDSSQSVRTMSPSPFLGSRFSQHHTILIWGISEYLTEPKINKNICILNILRCLCRPVHPFDCMQRGCSHAGSACDG